MKNFYWLDQKVYIVYFWSEKNSEIEKKNLFQRKITTTENMSKIWEKEENELDYRKLEKEQRKKSRAFKNWDLWVWNRNRNKERESELEWFLKSWEREREKRKRGLFAAERPRPPKWK